MREEEYYEPGNSGREAAISRKLKEWKELRERSRSKGSKNG
jgi:hypothetical protein